MSRFTITWELAKADERFVDFEDPTGQGFVPKASFEEVYGPVLEQLDGQDCSSYIDFFFEETHLCKGSWAFQNEDARLDFFDFAKDEGKKNTFISWFLYLYFLQIFVSFFFFLFEREEGMLVFSLFFC